MDYITLPSASLRKKVQSCINKYLSLSDNQYISACLYIKGTKYIIDFGNNEAELFYDIGSVSKTLTAQLILKLFREKGLDIHSPVSCYLKLKKGKYPTVYELLTHTAGYRHLTPLEITLPRLIKHRYSHYNPYYGVSKKSIIKALQKRNHHKSGHSYSYSDFPYAILALVAEAITKKPFYYLLEDFIKNDLKLENTDLLRQSSTPPAVYNSKKISFWRWEKENPYIASGGLVSGIYDILKYIELQIEGKEYYITDAQKLCPASFKEGRNLGTCTGWHTYKNSHRLWHVGGVGTFRASIMLNRKAGFGVTVLGNTKGIKSANIHFIAKMLYSEIKGNKLKKIIK